MGTKIQWADETWNPVTGCTPISDGCKNCYAQRMAQRLKGRCGYPKENPFAITFHPDRLDQPQKWKKPRRIFICSMGDLFHEKISYRIVDNVIMAAEKAPQHTYMLLTKRPKRMREYLSGGALAKNIWLGVTVEDRKTMRERLPILTTTPTANLGVRFVSFEPLLEHVDPKPWLLYIDWVIAGGETGPYARPADKTWIYYLMYRCKAREIKIPFFFKGWGTKSRDEFELGLEPGAIQATEECREIPRGL